MKWNDYMSKEGLNEVLEVIRNDIPEYDRRFTAEENYMNLLRKWNAGCALLSGSYDKKEEWRLIVDGWERSFEKIAGPSRVGLAIKRVRNFKWN